MPSLSEPDPPLQQERVQSRRPRRRVSRTAAGTASEGYRQTVAAVLLGVSVAGSVLAIGALHLPVLLVVSAVVFGAAAFATHRRALERDGLVLPMPALVLAGLSLFCLVQTVPLPARVVEAVAPVAADIWERCLLPFGEPGPHRFSLSLDPGASFVEALKWMTYAAVFVTAAAVAASRGAAPGVAMVFGAALAAALVTVGHGLAGATRVYGLYSPSVEISAWHVGPLLNPNTLAGYINLGAFAGLGIMLSERPLIPRWIAALGVALLVGVEITTASRGGVLSLVAGIALLAVVLRRGQGRAGVSRGLTAALIGAVTAGGALFAILGGTSKTWAELYDKDLSKLGMIVWAKPMIHDHPLFGVGRGAFESAFPIYRNLPGNMVFTHAENFAVQWVVEWGVPVGLGAIVLLAWLLSPRRLGVHKSSLAAGAWCGVAALLLQNVVDLALELPAVGIAAATVLGSLWGDAKRAPAREALRRPGPFSSLGARALAGAVVLLGAGLAAAAVAFGWHDVEADRRAVRDAFDAEYPRGGPPKASPDDPAAATERPPVRVELHRAMLRHPAEPYFPLIGAMAAVQSRTENPIPWLERALERAHVNGRAHLLLAQVLASRGARKQALLELRLAVEDDPSLVEYVAVLAVRWTKVFDELLVAVPEGARGSSVLSTAGALLYTARLAGTATAEEIDLGRRCDADAIVRDPHMIEPRAREAIERLDALDALRAGSAAKTQALCGDRAGCHAVILEHADAIARIAPDLALPAVLRARLLVAEDKPEEAARMLEKACDHVTDRVFCLNTRVATASRLTKPALLDAAGKDLLGASCVTPVACADTATFLAGIRQARGEHGVAAGLLARAAREDPSNEARWLRLADEASVAGAHAQAADALERVARRRGGSDPSLKQRLESERSQAMGGLLPH